MKLLKILIFLLILNSFILAGFLVSEHANRIISINNIEKANLTRVIDGDTIETDLGKIRLLGINTPEKNQEGYQQAKDFLKQFENKSITLEKTIEDKDMYGRFLRYVFYQSRFLNKEILALGLAHFYTYNEDKYTSSLRQAEEQARNSELGIWEKSQNVCASCIVLIKLNEIDPGEYLILGNKCGFSCNLAGWRIDDDSSSHTRKLDFSILAGGNKRLDYNGSVWNDDGDSFYLRDDSGKLVVFYRY